MKFDSKLVVAAIVAVSLSTCMVSPVFADNAPKTCNPPTCAPPPAPKAAQPAAPDVTLPFTFKCAHCGMKITIKKTEDWNKGCFACACGSKNIDCYEQTLKKPAN